MEFLDCIITIGKQVDEEKIAAFCNALSVGELLGNGNIFSKTYLINSFSS